MLDKCLVANHQANHLVSSALSRICRDTVSTAVEFNSRLRSTDSTDPTSDRIAILQLVARQMARQWLFKLDLHDVRFIRKY